MMKSIALRLAALALITGAPPAHAQQPPAMPPTTASAEVMQCAQSQMVVDRLLAAANARLETARQSNSASEMRVAVDELQATLRDVRAQLAPCANVQPVTAAHAGHTMAGAAASPAAASAPATKPVSTVPTAAAPKPAAPDPHAGHTMAPAKPAPAPKKSAPPPSKPAPTTKPPAGGDPHAGHTPSPASVSTAKEQTVSTAKEQTEATDPVCGLKVNLKTAPNAQHQGRTYHFCSDQHRQLFLKNPAKYLPGQK